VTGAVLVDVAAELVEAVGALHGAPVTLSGEA
jgi:hypothetical protein